jgi:hypothetical protein
MTVCENSAALPQFNVATLRTLRYLIEQPRTENNLHEVVYDQHVTKIHRFPAVHDPRTQHFNEVRVAETYGQGRERTAHQQPVVHTWV